MFFGEVGSLRKFGAVNERRRFSEGSLMHSDSQILSGPERIVGEHKYNKNDFG